MTSPLSSLPQAQLQQFLNTIKIESSSSSASQIDQHLNQIDQEIQRVKNQIRSKVHSNWNEFQNQYQIGHQLYLQSINHENQFQKINTDLDHPKNGIIPRLLSVLQSHQIISDKYHQSDQILRVNHSLSFAFKAISELSLLIYSDQLSDAAQKLIQFKSIVNEQAPHQSYSKLAKRSVKRIQELEEVLKQKLIDTIRASIVFQDREQVELLIQFKANFNLRPTDQSHPHLTWGSAIKGLQILGGDEARDEQLQKIAIKTLDKVTLPLVQSASGVSNRLHLLRTSEPDKLQCTLLLAQDNKDESTFALYGSLRLLLSTLQEMLLISDSLQESFAKYFIPPLQTHLTGQYLDSSLPPSTQDKTKLEILPELLKQTREFGHWLNENGWLACIPQNSSNALLDWCDNVKDRFVHKVASRVLERARKAMMTTQWESVVVPWDIVEEVELPRSQTSHLNPTLASSPLTKSASVDKPRSSSIALVRQLTEPTKQTSPVKEAIGFKSLFNFGNSISSGHDQSASSADRESLSPSEPEPKGFRSLFDFSHSTQSSSIPQNHSSSQTEKTSSPEIIERLSDVSSPQSVRSKDRLNQISPDRVDRADSNRAEEDVHWDMGCESLTENAVNQDLTPSKSHHKTLTEAEDEVEEDAWGLDEAPEETNAPVPPLRDQPILEDTAVTPSLNPTKSASSLLNPTSSANDLMQPSSAPDLVEEAGEPDPDAWGFEEEDLGLSNDADNGDQGVLRLRGGVRSTPSTEEDDDGWGWNEDSPSEQPEQSQSTPAATKKPKNIKPGQKSQGLTQSRDLQVCVRTEQLTISKLAQYMIELVKEVMEDAVVVSDPNFVISCLSESYSGLMGVGLDILDLFRVLMPTHHSQLLDSVPSLSIQFANDCDWLSKEISSIERLNSEMKVQTENVSKRFKQLSSSIRHQQLINQRSILMECLDESEGFIDTSNQENFNRCERSFKQIIHTLERLSQAWKPVMTKSQYLKSIGDLIESILNRILNEIQNQIDISESDSKCLNQLLKSLHCFKDFFVFEDHPTIDSSSSDSQISRYVPSWFKFNFLSELLEASMADIMWMAQEGLLVEFSPDEIVGLIKALFADSDLRAKNIDKIMSRSRT